MVNYSDIIGLIESQKNSKTIESIASFGINVTNAYGIPIPFLRSIAGQIGKGNGENNHLLVQQLWNSGIHELRILSSMIEDPDRITESQMDEWVGEFNSWDICDQCCGNLFSKSKYAFKKAMEWSGRKEEFVKRAGFVLMATVSIHDKNTGDTEFIKFLSIIKNNSTDNRNFVKKAVNWALRQIGKRNCMLNKKAIETANEILQINSRHAKWIASNAIKELTSPATQNRVNNIKKRI